MTNFNEMSLLNVSLLVFSALVTLFLLIGAITDMNRKSRFMSSFIILLISNILMQLVKQEYGFLQGNRRILSFLIFLR